MLSACIITPLKHLAKTVDNGGPNSKTAWSGKGKVQVKLSLYFFN